MFKFVVGEIENNLILPDAVTAVIAKAGITLPEGDDSEKSKKLNQTINEITEKGAKWLKRR